MRKSIFIAAGLFLSISTQAQLLDMIKSTVKDKTGIDLNNPQATKGTTTAATTNTKTTTTVPTSTSTQTSLLNVGNLTSTQISSGLKEALSLGVTD